MEVLGFTVEAKREFGILCRRPEGSHEIHDEDQGALGPCQRGSLGFVLHKVT